MSFSPKKAREVNIPLAMPEKTGTLLIGVMPQMKYLSFTIKNFKGIDELKIDFEGEGLLILAGLNESGKTTVLNAIHAWWLMTQGQPPRNGEKVKMLPKYETLWSGDISIGAKLLMEKEDVDKIPKRHKSFPKADEVVEIEFSYKVKNGQFESETPRCFIFRNEKGSSSKVSEAVKKSILDLIPPVLYYEDFCYDVPERISFSLSSDSSLAENSTSDPLNLMWQGILSDCFLSFKKEKQKQETEITFGEFLCSLSDENKRPSAENTLSQFSYYINTQIHSPWSEKIDLARKVDFKEVRLGYEIKNENVEFYFNIISLEGAGFSVNERSKGFKWFFSFVMLTTFRQARERNLLFLLDEPASNLHAHVQEEIAEQIIELSKQSHVIYTTHSPYMLDLLYMDRVRTMINEADEANLSDVTPKIIIEKANNVISQTNRRLHVRPILDFLNFTLPKALPSGNCLFVEGITDYFHLLLWQFLFPACSGDNAYRVHPFSGASTLEEDIALLKARKQGVKILLDGDKAGEDAKRKYSAIFSLLESDIYLHTDLNGENNIVIEDLYSEKDQQNIFSCAGREQNRELTKKERKQELQKSIQILLKNPEKIKQPFLEKKTEETIKKILDVFSFSDSSTSLLPCPKNHSRMRLS